MDTVLQLLQQVPPEQLQNIPQDQLQILIDQLLSADAEQRTAAQGGVKGPVAAPHLGPRPTHREHTHVSPASSSMRGRMDPSAPPRVPEDFRVVDDDTSIDRMGRALAKLLESPELIFRCHRCGRGFLSKDSLTTHHRTHPPVSDSKAHTMRLARRFYIARSQWVHRQLPDSIFCSAMPSKLLLQSPTMQASVSASSGAPSAALSLSASSADARKFCLPADSSIESCSVCNEPFEIFLDEEEGEWLFQGVVHNPSNPEEIIHVRCKPS